MNPKHVQCKNWGDCITWTAFFACAIGLFIILVRLLV